MPELPEVEITRENLQGWLAGRRIRRVEVPDPRTRRGQPEAAIRAGAEGRLVRAVRRRGKFLRLLLEGSGPALLSHLGMTGRWVRREPGEPDPPAARAILFEDRGPRAVFSDRRRFGHFSLALPADEERLTRLGPEPLGRAFTGRLLTGLLAASKRPVKNLLLDQDRVAGIGNIQAAESLWKARIHPARPAHSLSAAEAIRLHRAIRRTLRRSLREARGLEIVYVSEGRSGREAAAERFSAAPGRRACPAGSEGLSVPCWPAGPASTAPAANRNEQTGRSDAVRRRR